MPRKSSSKIQAARRWLAGGCVVREDSDDELGYDDLPWEWMYANSGRSGSERDVIKGTGKKRKRADSEDGNVGKLDGHEIVGARMGSFVARVGDAVLLKAADNQAWVGLITEFGEDEEGDKQAYFMWFSRPDEIRNKVKKRSDNLPVSMAMSQ
jgi:origin recognition complex subunit 1